jgi:hypothetical protein
MQLTLKIEIELGNEDMQTYFDLRHAIAVSLRELDGEPHAGEGTIIRDVNGNRIGRWSVEETQTFAERAAIERTRAGNRPWHEQEPDGECVSEDEMKAELEN